MKTPLFQVIARELNRYQNANNRQDIADDARAKVELLVKQFMPSGSGVDNGTHIDPDDCKNGKLVFQTAFHHMNENGAYTGWTDYTVIVSPSLQWGFDLHITGRDRNGIKSYLFDTYMHALRELIEDGTNLVRREDEAIAHLRAVLPHVVETDAMQALADARVFVKRLDGDFSA